MEEQTDMITPGETGIGPEKALTNGPPPDSAPEENKGDALLPTGTEEELYSSPIGEILKEKIIQAFKEPSIQEEDEEYPTQEIPVKEARIFEKKESRSDIIQEQAVRVLKEEMMAKESEIADETGETGESPSSPDEKPNQSFAEVLVVRGSDYAMGLSYHPGTIPVVVSLGKKKKARQLIQHAMDMNIPIVEVTDWNLQHFGKLEVGAEIPESMYHPASQALALVYRLHPSASYVRFIKALSPKKSTRKEKIQKRIEELGEILDVPPLSVELGSRLYIYKAELREQLEFKARRVIGDMGIIVPKVKILENSYLQEGEYAIKMKNILYETGILDLSFEPPELFYPLQTPFKSLLYNYGYELLGYLETEALIHRVKQSNPGLVRTLFPRQLTVGSLRFILRGLLKERIPIKDMTLILESIEENIHHTQDPELMIEYIRSAFSPHICNAYKDENGHLNVILLGKEMEQKIMTSIQESPNVRWLNMKYREGFELLSNIKQELQNVEKLGIPVVLLTSPVIRRFVRRITENNFPSLPIISYNEISPLTPVKTAGIIY